MMKRAVLVFVLLPALAVAAEDHAQGHAMHGDHDMAEMHAQMLDPAAGRPGDPEKVTRTIMVTMDDAMRFSPDRITVTAGETVRFFLKNSGKLDHEMVIGSLDDLRSHAEAMRTMPEMEYHAMPNMISLRPGQRGGLVWQFDTPGEVTFGCAVPGHLEAGMVGTVEVGS